MTKATATVPTENGWKYVQQLCKHWAHKLDVEVTESAQKGVVKFAEATAVMTSTSEGFTVELDAHSDAVLEQMKGVVSSHLDRFAFREAPLPFDWQAVA